MKKLQNVKFTEMIRAINNAVNTTSFTAVATDTLGYSQLDVLIMLGATDGNLSALKIQECDTTGGTYTDITGADFSVAPATLPLGTDDGGIFRVSIDLNRWRKRYKKVVATTGTVSVGTILGAWGILSRGSEDKQDVTSHGVVQELFV